MARRATVGELVYTLVSANRTQPGTNRKLFDIGEFLEFEDDEVVLPTLPLVPKQVDLQHNTNLLDMKDVGLSDDEIASLTELSMSRKKELESQVAGLQAQISDKQTAISENQKRLNETKKVINAVREIGGAQTAAIIARLETREADLNIERSSLIGSLTILNDQVKKVFDSLIKISGLVR